MFMSGTNPRKLTWDVVQGAGHSLAVPLPPSVGFGGREAPEAEGPAESQIIVRRPTIGGTEPSASWPAALRGGGGAVCQAFPPLPWLRSGFENATLKHHGAALAASWWTPQATGLLPPGNPGVSGTGPSFHEELDLPAQLVDLRLLLSIRACCAWIVACCFCSSLRSMAGSSW